jgi:hypothetical protein
MNGYSVRIHMYFEYMNGYNFWVFSNFSGTTIFNFISHLKKTSLKPKKKQTQNKLDQHAKYMIKIICNTFYFFKITN